MVIKFYKTNDPENKLIKSLSGEFTVNGELKESASILDLTISFKYSDVLLTYDYAYIPIFHRYYFITNFEIVGDIIKITFSVDVLMSHSDEIKNSKAHITRTKNGNNYLHDNLVTPVNKYRIQSRKLADGFTARNRYVLIVGGKI